MLLWTSLYKFWVLAFASFGYMADVELLGHIVILCLIFVSNHHIVFYYFKNWNIIVVQCVDLWWTITEIRHRYIAPFSWASLPLSPSHASGSSQSTGTGLPEFYSSFLRETRECQCHSLNSSPPLLHLLCPQVRALQIQINHFAFPPAKGICWWSPAKGIPPQEVEFLHILIISKYFFRSYYRQSTPAVKIYFWKCSSYDP